MQWTVRLEAATSAGEVTTTELVTFSRPAVVSTLADIGLMLDETKALWPGCRRAFCVARWRRMRPQFNKLMVPAVLLLIWAGTIAIP